MRKFDYYVGRAVLVATLAVLLLLTGLDSLISIIDESDDIGNGYQFADVLVYVGYTVPRRIYEFIPFAALIGALVALGRLAASSELVIVRASGVSLAGIAVMVLKPALVVALFGFAVGEFVAPHSEQLAMSHRALAQRSESAVAGRFGAWNRDGNTFIHVDAVQRGGVAYGVTLLTFDDEYRLVRSLVAERGTHAGDHWMLEQVRSTHVQEGGTAIQRDTLWRWDTAITPQLLTLDVVEPETLPILQLWPYARYLQRQGMVFVDIELAFWRKVLQPLATLALVLVAMSFIFGPLREGTMAARVFIGIIVGVTFRISQDFFGPASLIFGYDPLLAALSPIAACGLGGMWLLWRRA
ncbi:MAG: LPS export ABC transporter permease LptG [Luminiphilus sp.]|nr:LPS export ABC transporter permease LptG [Luminiphilus sp.]MDG1682939.1 LPS export ABC transporter permease LptG [Luminiphilus sp.]MDG2135513.1 LPS export ABC transporter permease LptG [Luminiphilus sp.]